MLLRTNVKCCVINLVDLCWIIERAYATGCRLTVSDATCCARCALELSDIFDALGECEQNLDDGWVLLVIMRRGGPLCWGEMCNTDNRRLKWVRWHSFIFHASVTGWILSSFMLSDVNVLLSLVLTMFFSFKTWTCSLCLFFILCLIDPTTSAPPPSCTNGPSFPLSCVWSSWLVYVSLVVWYVLHMSECSVFLSLVIAKHVSITQHPEPCPLFFWGCENVVEALMLLLANAEQSQIISLYCSFVPSSGFQWKLPTLYSLFYNFKKKLIEIEFFWIQFWIHWNLAKLRTLSTNLERWMDESSDIKPQ